jgi:sucrose synthase
MSISDVNHSPIETNAKTPAWSPSAANSKHAAYIDLLPPEAVARVQDFFHTLCATGHLFFLRDEVDKHLVNFLESVDRLPPRIEAGIRRLFSGCQEIVFYQGYAYVTLRPRIGVRRFVRLHPDESRFEAVTRSEYLAMKDAYVQGSLEAAHPGLHLNFAPYFRGYPKVKDPAMMGRGMSVLNAHLSGQMSQDPDRFQRALLQFLQHCKLDSMDILLSDHIDSPAKLLDAIEDALTKLSDLDPEMPVHEFMPELRVHGFEAGWGNTAKRVTESLRRLSDVCESADPERFEKFLGHLPINQNILMVSPHGWFAQADVLGKPDTGGQVTYVLDQARALEKSMRQRFLDCGLDVAPRILILTRLIPNAEGTTCGEPLEKVIGAEDCWIIRVPFRDAFGNEHPDWISRFHIWPYLEQFAIESLDVTTREFMGLPDLIVGHYSDGNLVAHLMAGELGVTHCACVHALEKTKYLFSDLRWAELEDEYHFSVQFTADILAYNSADYIISSSYREIGGTQTEMGMFESYETFSMPGIYRVESGMDPQLARYNIVPPGVSEDYFFPYTESERRSPVIDTDLTKAVLLAEPGPQSVGQLANPDLPPIFAMSRIDKVKNLTGLVELFGSHNSLRQHANLVVISSLTDASQSTDQEEIEQINRIYELIDQYDLHGHIRWGGIRLGKAETGEIYRLVADRRGVFAQPALMETFGLTVIEAMACGLPVVVTCFGGPAEIVVPGECGAVVNPNDHEAFGDALAQTVRDGGYWQRMSEGGIQRVHDAFRWQAHAGRVLDLANVYSYWNHLDVMNRSALDQYIHTLFHTVYRPRTQAMT